jgi:hypothetical protein
MMFWAACRPTAAWLVGDDARLFNINLFKPGPWDEHIAEATQTLRTVVYWVEFVGDSLQTMGPGYVYIFTGGGLYVYICVCWEKNT